ncbi:MAG: triose-phosphate isomerase [Candidatus Woesearchaeota archaeon]|nr:MAG: triose-phosphate isomerase [Candidatus Woesearchaeota archaeon]
MKPILVINFKTYEKATGKQAVKLAKACEEVAKKTKTKIWLAVQIADIYRVSEAVKLPVFSEHVDYQEPDSFTGSILVEDVKDNGAIGTLLNHSEHRLKLDVIEKTIKRCKKVKLKTLVCAASVAEAKKIAKFKPDYIAYEAPSLIGTGRSISKFKHKTVKQFVEELKKIDKKIIPLTGAGVSNGEDVKAAIDLGTHGALLASAVTKAKNPKKVLLDLVRLI